MVDKLERKPSLPPRRFKNSTASQGEESHAAHTFIIRTQKNSSTLPKPPASFLTQEDDALPSKPRIPFFRSLAQIKNVPPVPNEKPPLPPISLSQPLEQKSDKRKQQPIFHRPTAHLLSSVSLPQHKPPLPPKPKLHSTPNNETKKSKPDFSEGISHLEKKSFEKGWSSLPTELKFEYLNKIDDPEKFIEMMMTLQANPQTTHPSSLKEASAWCTDYIQYLTASKKAEDNSHAIKLIRYIYKLSNLKSSSKRKVFAQEVREDLIKNFQQQALGDHFIVDIFSKHLIEREDIDFLNNVLTPDKIEALSWVFSGKFSSDIVLRDQPPLPEGADPLEFDPRLPLEDLPSYKENQEKWDTLAQNLEKSFPTSYKKLLAVLSVFQYTQGCLRDERQPLLAPEASLKYKFYDLPAKEIAEALSYMSTWPQEFFQKFTPLQASPKKILNELNSNIKDSKKFSSLIKTLGAKKLAHLFSSKVYRLPEFWKGSDAQEQQLKLIQPLVDYIPKQVEEALTKKNWEKAEHILSEVLETSNEEVRQNIAASFALLSELSDLSQPDNTRNQGNKDYERSLPPVMQRVGSEEFQHYLTQSNHPLIKEFVALLEETRWHIKS